MIGPIRIPDPEDIWEAIQLLNGDIYIYHKGFKEEADMGDVFKYSSGETNQFSCFSANPLTPIVNSSIRLNRAIIAFAWYVDPNSNVIQELKRIIVEQKRLIDNE